MESIFMRNRFSELSVFQEGGFAAYARKPLDARRLNPGRCYVNEKACPALKQLAVQRSGPQGSEMF